MAARYPLIVNTGSAQIQELASGDDLNLTGSNISAVINVTASGFLTINSANNLTAIVNGGSNGVGNIGSSTTYFNTIFAKATTAQYADLAEMYEADQPYNPGTVLVFGGNSEVTTSTVSHDPAVAGIVSTNPSYLMNSELKNPNSVALALTGRVPCHVKGPVKKAIV